MTTTFNGKCNCGEVQWEVELTPEQQKHILCHCGVCQNLGGGAYTLNQVISKSALKFTKGGESLKKYTYSGDSGNQVHCYYCPNCTAHPYHHQTVQGDDTIILRTSLLTKGKEFPVLSEIYGKARLSWVPEVATTFETVPPS